MTFINKSYSKYNKVEKHVISNTSYEGSDDEKELEVVPVDNNNNGVNVVSDSDSESSNSELDKNDENIFDKDVDDHIIDPPKTTINAKVISTMKKLLASYNNNANKIKDATQVKVTKNLNFLIDLAMVAAETILVPEEPASFNKTWNHPDALLEKNGEKPL